MIADVRRAYVPTVKFDQNNFQQLSLAQIQALSNPYGQGQYPKIVPVKLDSTLVHRKIWAWFWSISATWAANVTLVGVSKGTTQFEQTILAWSTAAINNKYVWNWWTTTTFVGAVGEQVFVTIANTTTYGAAPFRMNTNIDELYLRINSISGAAANFDAGILVQSQQGI